MVSANDNSKSHERRTEIDCWLEGGPPYLVSAFDPSQQPEPFISEMFDTLPSARSVARSYARIHGITRLYDMADEAP